MDKKEKNTLTVRAGPSPVVTEILLEWTFYHGQEIMSHVTSWIGVSSWCWVLRSPLQRTKRSLPRPGALAATPCHLCAHLEAATQQNKHIQEQIRQPCSPWLLSLAGDSYKASTGLASVHCPLRRLSVHTDPGSVHTFVQSSPFTLSAIHRSCPCVIYCYCTEFAQTKRYFIYILSLKHTMHNIWRKEFESRRA